MDSTFPQSMFRQCLAKEMGLASMMKYLQVPQRTNKKSSKKRKRQRGNQQQLRRKERVSDLIRRGRMAVSLEVTTY